MTSFDAALLDQTYAQESPFALEAKMKFDPCRKILSSRTNQLKFVMGTGEASFPSITLRSGTYATNKTYLLPYVSLATTRTQWTKLPTIADYEDLEELYDLENTEIAFYEASKKFIW